MQFLSTQRGALFHSHRGFNVQACNSLFCKLFACCLLAMRKQNSSGTGHLLLVNIPSFSLEKPSGNPGYNQKVAWWAWNQNKGRLIYDGGVWWQQVWSAIPLACKMEEDLPLKLDTFRRWVKELTLFWVPPKANPEMRIWVQVVYLGGGSRKQRWQTKEVKQRREGSQYRCVTNKLPSWATGT